jgi:rubredoxin
MYVENAQGKRITCPHPEEKETILRVLGEDAPQELIEERTGFNSYCICLDCFHQFVADLGEGEDDVLQSSNQFKRPKDKRECPRCQSTNVKTILELVGHTCPKCGIGTIEEIDTGIIT